MKIQMIDRKSDKKRPIGMLEGGSRLHRCDGGIHQPNEVVDLIIGSFFEINTNFSKRLSCQECDSSIEQFETIEEL